MHDISILNKQFGIANKLKFELTTSGQVIIQINNQFAKASLALQGAHLLSWKLTEGEEVIWLSEDAVFSKGKSIRGGIPVCWPWFGSHSDENTFPSHGYVRTAEWEVTETKELIDGRTYLGLKLSQEILKEKYHFDGLDLELQVIVGETLEMVMISRNSSEKVITVGGAFHTYFNVSNIQNITIRGLENQIFIDALNNGQQKKEAEPILINAEIDRIYLDDPESSNNNDCVIEDTGWMRKIRISKQGSYSTVVWNPWIEKSKKLGDMGNDGYKNMICVETTNAANDVVSIEPGGEHCLSVCYQLEQ